MRDRGVLSATAPGFCTDARFPMWHPGINEHSARQTSLQRRRDGESTERRPTEAAPWWRDEYGCAYTPKWNGRCHEPARRARAHRQCVACLCVECPEWHRVVSAAENNNNDREGDDHDDDAEDNHNDREGDDHDDDAEDNHNDGKGHNHYDHHDPAMQGRRPRGREGPRR